MMNYNIDNYRHVVAPQIKAWIDSKPGTVPADHAGDLALYTSCPIVVVCQLIAELYGSTPELTAQTERLIKFYAGE